MKARPARAISGPTASTSWLPAGPTTATILLFEVNCWVTVVACAGFSWVSPWTSVILVLLRRLSAAMASSAKCNCSCPSTATGPVSGPSMPTEATHALVVPLALPPPVVLLLLLQPAATSAPSAVAAMIALLFMDTPSLSFSDASLSLPPPASRRPGSVPSAAGHARLQRDLGDGQSAPECAVLGPLRQVTEGSLVHPGHVADGAQLDAGDVEAGADLGERHPRGGAQVPCRMTGLTQQVRERHREAGCFGRAEQFLGVSRLLALFHAGPQRVWPVEGTAAERYPAAALGHGSLPARLGAADDPETHNALPQGCPMIGFWAESNHALQARGREGLFEIRLAVVIRSQSGPVREEAAGDRNHPPGHRRRRRPGPLLVLAGRIRVSRRPGRLTGARRRRRRDRADSARGQRQPRRGLRDERARRRDSRGGRAQG